MRRRRALAAAAALVVAFAPGCSKEAQPDPQLAQKLQQLEDQIQALGEELDPQIEIEGLELFGQIQLLDGSSAFCGRPNSTSSRARVERVIGDHEEADEACCELLGEITVDDCSCESGCVARVENTCSIRSHADEAIARIELGPAATVDVGSIPGALATETTPEFVDVIAHRVACTGLHTCRCVR